MTTSPDTAHDLDPAPPRTAQPGRSAGTSPTSARHRARVSLIPFALSLLALTLLQHAVIVLLGNQIGLFASLSTAAIALGYAIYLVVFATSLSQVRFGLLAAHTVVFAVVNTGFHLHLFVLAAMGSATVQGTPGFPLDAGWFGVTLGMATFWGLGLACHALGAVLSRGFEFGAHTA